MRVVGRLLPLAFWALTGCTVVLGPIDSPEFPSLVQDAVPAQDGVVVMFGPGAWVPNMRGFTDVRTISFGHRPIEPTPGILVVTTSAILIEQWDNSEKQFDTIKRFSIRALRDVKLDKFGVGRRLVLFWEDFSVDSFSFTRPDGRIDALKTERAEAWLRSRIANGS